jgi:chromosomal replication initiator protein
MTDYQKIWREALVEIELEVSKANFGTWFRNTSIIKQDDGTVYLGVPSIFVRDWLLKKYHQPILKVLRNLNSEIKALEYQIIKNPESAAKHQSAASSHTPPVNNQQLSMVEFTINREDNLNPKYIFESFIVGPFNELAHAAAQAVIRKVGLVYNPLFIYGPTGVGKTHLLQAMGNHIKKMHPNKKVYYVTSEQFVTDYVNSVQANRGNFFKEKYRKYDTLIMDDIQFLSNKDRSQEELFHLFNNFYENNKQIIFSSDKPPKVIPNLEDRLKSRFEGGMVTDISKPDYESRLAILQSKARNIPFCPSEEVISYVASLVQDSIRELEGTLNTIVCQAQLKNRPVSLTEAKQLVKNSVKPKKVVSIKNLAVAIANYYNINEKHLYEKTRKKEVVKPRQVIMYLLREDFNTSYPYIGQKLGGRDHTTVIHAYEKIKKDLAENNLLKQEIEQIRALLYSE